MKLLVITIFLLSLIGCGGDGEKSWVISDGKTETIDTKALELRMQFGDDIIAVVSGIKFGLSTRRARCSGDKSKIIWDNLLKSGRVHFYLHSAWKCGIM